MLHVSTDVAAEVSSSTMGRRTLQLHHRYYIHRFTTHHVVSCTLSDTVNLKLTLNDRIVDRFAGCVCVSQYICVPEGQLSNEVTYLACWFVLAISRLSSLLRRPRSWVKVHGRVRVRVMVMIHVMVRGCATAWGL